MWDVDNEEEEETAFKDWLFVCDTLLNFMIPERS